MDGPIQPTIVKPRTGMARLSLGFGIASYLLLLGPFTGIPAILAGHLALRRSRREPESHGGSGKAIAGLVLGYVSLLVGLPLIAVALSLAVPPYLAARERDQAAQCQNHLSLLATNLRNHVRDHPGEAFPRLETLPGIGTDPDLLFCPKDPNLRKPPGTGQPGSLAGSYDRLGLPGLPDKAGDQAVLRCPYHGTTISLDGTTRPGKVGKLRSKTNR